MKVVVGSPGTWSGLLLRIGQCAFAGASIGFMVSALGFSNYTAFCYLISSMGLQALWSLGLACVDIYALKIKRDLHNPMLVSLFLVGDWKNMNPYVRQLRFFASFMVTAILSLAAACSSAAITVLFARDSDFCRITLQFSCGKFEISIALAFLTWLLIAVSSLVMFWLLASA